jgi:hypothetical protein
VADESYWYCVAAFLNCAQSHLQPACEISNLLLTKQSLKITFFVHNVVPNIRPKCQPGTYHSIAHAEDIVTEPTAQQVAAHTQF